MRTHKVPKPNCSNYTFKQISRAITEKSCPICLCRVEDRHAAVIKACRHVYCIECISRWSRVKLKCPLCNVEFDSWFCRINLSARTFQEEKLWRDDVGKRVNSIQEGAIRWRRNRLSQERMIRRSRGEAYSTNSRTRPLPRRRSFGLPGEVDPLVIANRVLRWRASIYELRMQAIPCSSKTCLVQQIARNSRVKDLVLQKIEPWIRRELHAMLGDPDPAVIVHVATSLFFSIHGHAGSLGQLDVRDDLTPLRRFLHEKTDLFWHELRCFAESSLSMETYDSVVEYKLTN